MSDSEAAITPITGLHNTTAWYNLTHWNVNVTRYTSSLEGFVLAAPRILVKLGHFVTSDSLGNDGNNHLVPGRSGFESNSHTNLYPSEADVFIGGAQRSDSHEAVFRASTLSHEGARGFTSVFSYATSKWALACVAMAIILNRTHIYAATRRRLRLRWTLRLLIRCLPIALITIQAVQLLQVLQCQTSPAFAELRWGNSTKSSDLMYAHPNRFFNGLGSLLLGATDEQSCRAVNMIRDAEDGPAQDLRGSLSRLWPLFGSFCLSHFLETLSCAVQGRPHAYETAMTLFEQSLAFAEADAAVNNQLSWATKASTATGAGATTSGGVSATITRSMIMGRVNTSPEVLYVALLSSLTHISSHLLGVFDKQSRYRLVNTGFWAFAFMSTLIWSAASFDIDDPASQGLLRFPTVCIIGLIPHIMVLIGIILCLSIYAFGVFLSAMSPPVDEARLRLKFRHRLVRAHQNMQANVSLSEIRISREMDIYTALLRTGFAAVTMASEAVYLNEDRGVGLKSRTWLEEARLVEAEELQRAWAGIGNSASRYDHIGAIGLVPITQGSLAASSGYSRERAAQKVAGARTDRGMRVGVGASERSTRWVMAVELFVNICRLFARIVAVILLWLIGLARIRAKPIWLLRMARLSKEGQNASSKAKDAGSGSSQASEPQNPNPVAMDALDIEAEIRRTGIDQSEENLDADLYSYWLHGGWWGSKDSSGEFLPSHLDDEWDTTSVITTTTGIGDTDDESMWASEEEGQRTPTQRTPRTARPGTPQMDSPFSMHDLAELLQPKSPEQRGRARNLAAHFQSEGILTRSQYRRMEQLQRTRILRSPQSAAGPLQPDTKGRETRPVKLDSEEEEYLLEQLLLNRREAAEAAKDTDGHAELSGLGPDGPHCVVCQSAPRAIILWPCRCLSLCDDCRVSLAMNNFDKCVCCRREVMSFSRIYVP